MKLSGIICLTILFLILSLGVGVISAENNIDINATEDNLLNEKYVDVEDDILENADDNLVELSDNDELVGDNSSKSKTITIVADKNNPNQVLNPTVQPAIDEANPGDTIVLKGTFIHCHFTIDKPLNIISSNGAVLSPCPHIQSEGAGSFGVFYIPDGGSGTVIKGFTFSNSDKADAPFSLLIRGASNVTVQDCTMDYVNPDADKYNGIIIENSNNVTLDNLIINNTINGIIINGSSDISIISNHISNNVNNAIKVLNDSKNIYVVNNSIKKNGKTGICLFNVDNVNIINNFIENNGVNNYDNGSGVYVNSNITKLVVKGNIFLSNGLHAIMYDYRTRNLNNDVGANELTIVDNNYFSGHSSMILHHRVYIKSDTGGYRYDEEKDVYIADSNGKYTEAKSYSYMLHSFIDADSVCGYTYYTTKIPWNLDSPGNNGKYDLSLSIGNITQLKKGIYQVSIVDKNGNIAVDLSSFNVTFYLNSFSTVQPKENEIFKSVRIQNGTVAVDFRDLKDKYLKNGNVITASFPGFSMNVENNPHVQLRVDDSDIPGTLIESHIAVNDLSVSYNSGKYLSAVLSDVEGNKLVGKSVTIKIADKIYNETTDDEGEVNLKINLNVGTYDAIFNFYGDEDYNVSSNSCKVTVSKATPKLTSSVLTTFPLSNAYFKVKLTDNNGNVLSGQKITFKINGKSYSAKTDKKGIAKVNVLLTNKKTYNVNIKFEGNTKYTSLSKTGKIVVKTGNGKSKITAKNIKIKKNSKKTYAFKLTSLKGKSIPNQKVIVKFNGKTYTVKTNAKGIAKVKIKLNKVKKYKINMKFLGNSQFKAVSKTCSIKIKN